MARRMAGSGKQMARSKSPVVLLLLALLALSLVFFFFSFHTPSSSYSDSTVLLHHNEPSYKPQTSFVASLERFLLAHKSNPPKLRDDTVPSTLIHQISKQLDHLVFQSENHRLYGDPYFLISMPLRVYVYDMPSKFTYDLLWLFRNSYKETSNHSPLMAAPFTVSSNRDRKAAEKRRESV